MKQIIQWLDRYLEEVLLAVFLIAMTLIMGIQVLSRYLFGASLSWSEELTRYLFIWSGFLSVSYCTKLCISIKIEQFVAMLSRRNKAMVKVINHTIELLFFFYMIPFAFDYMMSAVHNGQISPACGLPMYYVQAAPFVSFVLVSIRILQRWWIEFQIAAGKPVYDPVHPERNTPDSFISANSADTDSYAPGSEGSCHMAGIQSAECQKEPVSMIQKKDEQKNEQEEQQ